MKSTILHRVAVVGGAAATAVAVCCVAGCYERVVGARGMGASYADVQPEYRSNTAADRAWDSMFSSPKPSGRSQRWVDPETNGIPVK